MIRDDCKNLVALAEHEANSLVGLIRRASLVDTGFGGTKVLLVGADAGHVLVVVGTAASGGNVSLELAETAKSARRNLG